MQNAERRMHCLLAVRFTCVCLRLAFICWKGQHFIVVGPFQQIKANRKQTQVKLTASKQCIRRSAFCVLRSAFCVQRSAFSVRRSAFGVRRFTPAGCCFIRKWGIVTETLVSRKLRTGLLIRNSNSEKDIHFRGRDTLHQPSDLSTDAIF